MNSQFEKEIKSAVKYQKLIYSSYWVAIILGVLIGEFILVDIFDMLKADAQMAYVAETIIILASAGIIPLALKVFGMKMTQKDWANTPLTDGISYYNKWSTIRIVMLGVISVSALFIHYLFMSPGAGFCTLIISFAAFFCIPSKKKLVSFVGHNQEQIEQNENDETAAE